MHHVAGSELSWRNVCPVRALAQSCAFGWPLLGSPFYFFLGLFYTDLVVKTGNFPISLKGYNFSSVNHIDCWSCGLTPLDRTRWKVTTHENRAYIHSKMSTMAAKGHPRKCKRIDGTLGRKRCVVRREALLALSNQHEMPGFWAEREDWSILGRAE